MSDRMDAAPARSELRSPPVLEVRFGPLAPPAAPRGRTAPRADRANLSPAGIRSRALLAVGAWLAAACAVGLEGVLRRPDRPPLALLAFLVVPATGFVVAWRSSASFRAFTGALSLPWLVGSHLWRFVGLGFLVAWGLGRLPAGFAIPAGVGDGIAALGALLLLPRLRSDAPPRGALLAWNVFGLVDLVGAVALGVLYGRGSLGLLAPGTPGTDLLVTFPVSLIPTFLVPLFALLHGCTLVRIAALAPGAEGAPRPR